MASPHKVGLVSDALISGWHFVWSLFVGIGSAQPILDFIFWAHMIKPVYSLNRSIQWLRLPLS